MNKTFQRAEKMYIKPKAKKLKGCTKTWNFFGGSVCRSNTCLSKDDSI